MRRALAFSLLAAATVLVACPSPPKNGECKTSKDCEAQAGFGKVCVEGTCRECAADTDCKDGFLCKANRCEPKPVATTTAPVEPKRECQSDGECGPGRGCDAAGKCVEKVPAACADAAAFTVYFGFDQSSLTPEATATVQKLADCLAKAPAKRLQVDGHCDERGTTQYNLALGKKRAEAVRKYLGDLGAGAGVETNTYGKEQPVCRESTETCWAKNRRAEFKIGR